MAMVVLAIPFRASPDRGLLLPGLLLLVVLSVSTELMLMLSKNQPDKGLALPGIQRPGWANYIQAVG